MIRNHLRSKVVGYLALFVALSGTTVALCRVSGVPSVALHQ
jgi:hypothetical protein